MITNFIPEIWSANLLLPLRASLVYGQAGVINRDYEGDIAAAGDTVHITNFADPAVRTYTKNAGTTSSNITWDNLTDSTQALVVDQADYFAFKVDDIDKRQSQPGFVAAASTGASYGLSEKADQYLAAMMAAGAANSLPDVVGLSAAPNDTDPMTGTANFYDDVLVPMRTALARSNVPANGRFCIVPPEVYALLLRDERFVRTDMGQPGPVVQNGQVGKAAGFAIIESNLTPIANTNTGGSTNTGNGYTVLAGHSMATTFAQQIASVEAVRLQDTFGDGVKGLHLYGGKVVRSHALVKCNIAFGATALAANVPVIPASGTDGA